MQSTVPLNVAIKEELKQNAEAILSENGVYSEEALTFLHMGLFLAPGNINSIIKL